MDKVTLLELEDVAKRYRHPSIIDIKLGFRTWYPTADQRYIDKCKAKDASTTQAALGFKICGMQVHLLVHFLLGSGSACMLSVHLLLSSRSACMLHVHYLLGSISACVLLVTGCISEEPTCL